MQRNITESSLDNISTLQNKISNISQPYHGHGLDQQFAQIIGLTFLAIIIVAVACNVVLVSAIFYVSRLHSVLHLFIVNMAASDLMTAIGSIPFDVEYMLRGYFPHGKVVCGIMQTAFLISLPSSVLCLTLLTAERFVAVIYPFRIREIITKRRIIMAIVSMWIYVFLVGLFPMMYNPNAIKVTQGICGLSFPLEYNIFQVSVNFLLPILFICGVNVVLFVTAHRHAKNQSSITSRLNSSNSSDNSKHRSMSDKGSIKNETLSRKQTLSKNLKAAKRIALLVGVFLVCWLSFIIIVAINFICVCIPRELTWIANVINYSSTAINPVLYGLLNKTIRQEVWSKVRRCLRHYFPSLYRYRFMRGQSLFQVRIRKRGCGKLDS